ncbi:MAG: laccase domain-containing protein, partial [Clostridia bacterium]
MYITHIISYGNAWGNLKNNYSSIFGDVQNFISQINISEIQKYEVGKKHVLNAYSIRRLWRSNMRNHDWLMISHTKNYSNQDLSLLGFLKNNISHCFTTRIGGVSEGPFKSLNLACGAGELRDSKENVYKNHELVANIFGLTAADICKTVQEHTADILYADETFRGVGLTKPQFNFAVDGLVTDKSGVLLSVRAADCVPILFCDKRAGVVAALHSGWRGTAQNAPVNA